LEVVVPRALIVEGRADSGAPIAELARSVGYHVVEVDSVHQARSLLVRRTPDVILLDLDLSDGSARAGIAALDEVCDAAASAAVVLITDRPNVDTAVEALRRGVADYLWRPVDVERLRGILAELATTHRRRPAPAADAAPDGPPQPCAGLVGRSRPLQHIYELIERVGPTSATVIVTGESGTGKEVVARALHEHSRRRRWPFEAVNCGAISTTLTETELFGHERGSFTGAERRHKGYFERAGRGTLFLDEITEMPSELQVKLLRILETGEYTRVGGETGLAMEARVIAATNRDVDEAVAAGQLREDLYYRLKVFQIYLPPLRDRADDIPLLVDHFLEQLRLIEGVRKQMSPEALEVLCGYPWPGNVRELRNVVHSSSVMAAGPVIRAEELPDEVRRGEPDREFDCSRVSLPIGLTLTEIEHRVIVATLASHHGDKTKAANVLGISLKSLYTRLNRYRKAEVA
jgi:DNA-binding NtrC family response regulator